MISSWALYRNTVYMGVINYAQCVLVGRSALLLLLLLLLNIIVTVTSGIRQDEFAGQCQRCDGVLVHQSRQAACNSNFFF